MQPADADAARRGNDPDRRRPNSARIVHLEKALGHVMTSSYGGSMTDSGTPKLTLSVVEDLKGKGFSQSEIANMFGVTRQYVSWIKRQYGGRRTPKEMVMDHFPWKVPAIQSHASAYRRLRDHGEYVATGGVGMDEEKIRRLRSFYRKLKDDDVVVEFDPEIPPVKGVSTKGGWAFRKRLPEDQDLIIRVNEHTNLTDEGRMIWRLPLVAP